MPRSAAPLRNIRAQTGSLSGDLCPFISRPSVLWLPQIRTRLELPAPLQSPNTARCPDLSAPPSSSVRSKPQLPTTQPMRYDLLEFKFSHILQKLLDSKKMSRIEKRVALEAPKGKGKKTPVPPAHVRRRFCLCAGAAGARSGSPRARNSETGGMGKPGPTPTRRQLAGGRGDSRASLPPRASRPLACRLPAG